MTPLRIRNQSRAHSRGKANSSLLACSLVSTDLQTKFFKKNIEAYLFESTCFFLLII